MATLHCVYEDVIARDVRKRLEGDVSFRQRRDQTDPGVSLEGFGFFDYLSTDAPLELVPDEVTGAIAQDMLNEAWDTGVEGLAAFCIDLLPVIDAIERMP
jgi:hypothetical protein